VRLLLDTHIFIWWDRQLRRVPRDVRSIVEDGTNDILVSAATVWEIAIKRRTGKLVFPIPITASH
jgi:PIN domain nuclease of toxin-antitoxin system